MFRLVKPILKQRTAQRFGSGQAHGNEPGGYFLGLKPGRKLYKWEKIWIVGFYGSFAVYFGLEAYAPKTTPTQRAEIEANKRLAAKGEVYQWPYPAK